MSNKRIYNRVMNGGSICIYSELLTDKELKRFCLVNDKSEWPNTAKVAVKSKDIYYSHGVRFAENYELIKQKNVYIATFWRGNPQLKNGGYFTTKEFRSTSLQEATKQAERYAADTIYGSMVVKNIELKQENSNGKVKSFL